VIGVNIPMFRAWAWDSLGAGPGPALALDVIVGRAVDTRTPVFLADMRHVEFRPYWNVPTSILRGEILPALARDPDYLARHDMEIVAGLGDAAPPVPLSGEALRGLRNGTLRVRQRPGPRNALGLIKFAFPNSANIYMHGTPAGELFARHRRDFSHGCVRVDDPVALAEWVLEDQPEWTRERIVAAMHGEGPHRVDLARPVQVVLFYVTVVVMPEDGSVHFADDIYGHDARLEHALERARSGEGGGFADH
jgi:murein L,D-transpeptidase YcbB/YkuD